MQMKKVNAILTYLIEITVELMYPSLSVVNTLPSCVWKQSVQNIIIEWMVAKVARNIEMIWSEVSLSTRSMKSYLLLLSEISKIMSKIMILQCVLFTLYDIHLAAALRVASCGVFFFIQSYFNNCVQSYLNVFYLKLSVNKVLSLHTF